MQNHEINGLFTDLSIIKGIGNQTYEKYCRLLGKDKVRIVDLLWHFPNKIIQRNNITKIKDLIEGEVQTVCGKIEKHKKGFRNAPHQFEIYDGTGILSLIYFKLPFYMESKLKIGDEKYISGKVKKTGLKTQIAHPDLLLSLDEFSSQRKFEPIYSLTAGLSNKQIIQTIENIFEFIDGLELFIEWHSDTFLQKNNWKKITETFKDIHLPNEDYFNDSNNNPIKRLAYDEILINQIKIEHIRRIRQKSNGISMFRENSIIDKLRNGLAFELSDTQKKAISEIYTDMAKPNQMIRLLQGDVGSGKTIVSFFAGLKCIISKHQFALMAPTEILAKQHYENFKKFTTQSNIKSCLLTSNTPIEARKEISKKISNGGVDAIIGTHSLFQEKIIYKNLGLVIIDEQHRFGVHQRLSLQKKSIAGKADLLLMTATPIPRTLIQIRYGDIEVSDLKDLPNKRKIETTIISTSKLKKLIDRLNNVCSNKNKIFWVCPQISTNDSSNMSVNDRYKFLKEHMRHNVSIIHGKMSEKEKDGQMIDFLKDKTNVLVATSVIEVGIDIKAANIIVIENANNFGLSQIHQLRGRVGRNDQKSWCILLHDNDLNEISKGRLKIIKESSDGYKIATEDMLIRGYGDIFGYRQSGFIDFKALNENLISELGEKAEQDGKLILDRILNDDACKSKYKRLFDFYEAHEFKYIIS
ncbi:MAG: ATP-dependent DNA helicase RecG [Alphaproteobacteria bacterium]